MKQVLCVSGLPGLRISTTTRHRKMYADTKNPLKENKTRKDNKNGQSERSKQGK